MMKNYYNIVFEPEVYGIITYRAYTRELAYELYHRLKETVGTRPGKLYVKEFIWQPQTQTYKEQYLCSYRTGKDMNVSLIIENMIKDLKHITNDIYNVKALQQRIDELSKLETNMFHGIELLDTIKAPKHIKDIIVDNIQMSQSVRRGQKHLLEDAKGLNPRLKELENLLKSIKSKLDNNKDWRKEDKPNAKGNNEARNRYLSSLGINIEAYDENDTDNMIDPSIITGLIKDIIDDNKKGDRKC